MPEQEVELFLGAFSYLRVMAGSFRRASVHPDLFARVSKRIDVDHPTEELRHPSTVHSIAFGFGEDRPVRPELFPIGRLGVAFRWKTDIHVGMPLRYAERNPLVETILIRPLWRRVHGAFQLITVHSFLIKEGRRLPRVKPKCGLQSAPLVSEMIVRLFHVREKRFVAILDHLPIVPIGFQRVPKGGHDLGRPLLIGRICLPKRCPAEMRSHVSVRRGHRSDGFLAVMFVQPAIFVFRLVRGVVEREPITGVGCEADLIRRD